MRGRYVKSNMWDIQKFIPASSLRVVEHELPNAGIRHARSRIANSIVCRQPVTQVA